MKQNMAFVALWTQKSHNQYLLSDKMKLQLKSSNSVLSNNGNPGDKLTVILCIIRGGSSTFLNHRSPCGVGEPTVLLKSECQDFDLGTVKNNVSVCISSTCSADVQKVTVSLPIFWVAECFPSFPVIQLFSFTKINVPCWKLYFVCFFAFASYSSFSFYCILFIGVDFKIKTIELRGKKIRLQIWDTAGQERFNSITSAYYRSAKGIVLVYDITKKETFEDVPKWMKMIDKYASEDAELLLVGNKLDCEVDRAISRQQGEKFALQVTGMRFCEASAKDNYNVNEIFMKLVDDILNKLPDVPRRELSNSILSLQPEPEIPPELPPLRQNVRCC
ncbi:ras-related protein Rab-12 [Rhincodon typus]|uniref:ras-related protein Rab-12 n=1 Tax=Rhincodon typus TaxID=259920 RepID=UPI00202E3DDE|nr:ras-related protein Rab-12 [Rhincodon typus]